MRRAGLVVWLVAGLAVLPVALAQTPARHRASG